MSLMFLTALFGASPSPCDLSLTDDSVHNSAGKEIDSAEVFLFPQTGKKMRLTLSGAAHTIERTWNPSPSCVNCRATSD